jgi:hypothetical protein
MKNKVKTYEKVLEWSYQVCFGFCSIDDSDHLLIEFWLIINKLSYPGFYKCIEHLVNCAEYITNELEKFEEKISKNSEDSEKFIEKEISSDITEDNLIKTPENTELDNLSNISKSSENNSMDTSKNTPSKESQIIQEGYTKSDSLSNNSEINSVNPSENSLSKKPPEELEV